MKKLQIILLLSVFFVACADTKPSGDLQGELDSLLTQQAAINERIRELKAALKEANGDASSSKLVAISSMDSSEFRHFVEIQAKVDGDKSVSVSPRAQGIVDNILVSEGEKVEKGQVLANLDDQVLLQTRGEVQTQYEFAKNVYQKQKNLWDQNIGSEIQYLTAKNNKESLGKRLAAINEQIDMMRLRAPVNGTVDAVSIKLGQAVMPGVPAFHIVNLSELKVKGEVGESFAGKIQEGDEVILFFPDQNKEIASRVSFAAQSINTLNRTFTVEAPVEGDVSGISPNMVVVMKILDYTKRAIVLPVDMLQRSGEGNYVMAATNSSGKLTAERKKVEVGRIYNGKAEIVTGLSASDTLVTTGYRDLNAGQELRIK